MAKYAGFEGVGEDIAGPLIGGGVAQAAVLTTKMIAKDKPFSKWAGLVGTLAGGLASGALMFSPRYRRMGIQGLITAVLVGVPRQVEDLMSSGPTAGSYLGLITPEAQMQGMGAYMPVPSQDMQMLGQHGLGTIVAERELNGMGMGAGVPEVEIMGAFGSNFMSQS